MITTTISLLRNFYTQTFVKKTHAAIFLLSLDLFIMFDFLLFR